MTNNDWRFGVSFDHRLRDYVKSLLKDMVDVVADTLDCDNNNGWANNNNNNNNGVRSQKMGNVENYDHAPAVVNDVGNRPSEGDNRLETREMDLVQSRVCNDDDAISENAECGLSLQQLGQKQHEQQEQEHQKDADFSEISDILKDVVESVVDSESGINYGLPWRTYWKRTAVHREAYRVTAPQRRIDRCVEPAFWQDIVAFSLSKEDSILAESNGGEEEEEEEEEDDIDVHDDGDLDDNNDEVNNPDECRKAFVAIERNPIAERIALNLHHKCRADLLFGDIGARKPARVLLTCVICDEEVEERLAGIRHVIERHVVVGGTLGAILPPWTQYLREKPKGKENVSPVKCEPPLTPLKAPPKEKEPVLDRWECLKCLKNFLGYHKAYVHHKNQCLGAEVKIEKVSFYEQFVEKVNGDYHYACTKCNVTCQRRKMIVKHYRAKHAPSLHLIRHRHHFLIVLNLEKDTPPKAKVKTKFNKKVKEEEEVKEHENFSKSEMAESLDIKPVESSIDNVNIIPRWQCRHCKTAFEYPLAKRHLMSSPCRSQCHKSVFAHKSVFGTLFREVKDDSYRYSCRRCRSTFKTFVSFKSHFLTEHDVNSKYAHRKGNSYDLIKWFIDANDSLEKLDPKPPKEVVVPEAYVKVSPLKRSGRKSVDLVVPEAVEVSPPTSSKKLRRDSIFNTHRRGVSRSHIGKHSTRSSKVSSLRRFAGNDRKAKLKRAVICSKSSLKLRESFFRFYGKSTKKSSSKNAPDEPNGDSQTPVSAESGDGYEDVSSRDTPVSDALTDGQTDLPDASLDDDVFSSVTNESVSSPFTRLSQRRFSKSVEENLIDKKSKRSLKRAKLSAKFKRVTRKSASNATETSKVANGQPISELFSHAKFKRVTRKSTKATEMSEVASDEPISQDVTEKPVEESPPAALASLETPDEFGGTGEVQSSLDVVSSLRKVVRPRKKASGRSVIYSSEAEPCEESAEGEPSNVAPDELPVVSFSPRRVTRSRGPVVAASSTAIVATETAVPALDTEDATAPVQVLDPDMTPDVVVVPVSPIHESAVSPIGRFSKRGPKRFSKSALNLTTDVGGKRKVKKSKSFDENLDHDDGCEPDISPCLPDQDTHQLSEKSPIVDGDIDDGLPLKDRRIMNNTQMFENNPIPKTVLTSPLSEHPPGLDSDGNLASCRSEVQPLLSNRSSNHSEVTADTRADNPTTSIPSPPLITPSTCNISRAKLTVADDGSSGSLTSDSPSPNEKSQIITSDKSIYVCSQCDKIFVGRKSFKDLQAHKLEHEARAAEEKAKAAPEPQPISRWCYICRICSKSEYSVEDCAAHLKQHGSFNRGRPELYFKKKGMVSETDDLIVEQLIDKKHTGSKSLIVSPTVGPSIGEKRKAVAEPDQQQQQSEPKRLKSNLFGHSFSDSSSSRVSPKVELDLVSDDGNNIHDDSGHLSSSSMEKDAAVSRRANEATLSANLATLSANLRDVSAEPASSDEWSLTAPSPSSIVPASKDDVLLKYTSAAKVDASNQLAKSCSFQCRLCLSFRDRRIHSILHHVIDFHRLGAHTINKHVAGFNESKSRKRTSVCIECFTLVSVSGQDDHWELNHEECDKDGIFIELTGDVETPALGSGAKASAPAVPALASPPEFQALVSPPEYQPSTSGISALTSPPAFRLSTSGISENNCLSPPSMSRRLPASSSPTKAGNSANCVDLTEADGGNVASSSSFCSPASFETTNKQMASAMISRSCHFQCHQCAYRSKFIHETVRHLNVSHGLRLDQLNRFVSGFNQFADATGCSSSGKLCLECFLIVTDPNAHFRRHHRGSIWTMDNLYVPLYNQGKIDFS